MCGKIQKYKSIKIIVCISLINFIYYVYISKDNEYIISSISSLINTKKSNINNKTNERICEHFSIYSQDNFIENIIYNENNVNINISDINVHLYDLSIIFGTRNDNYGDNLIDRITTTL